MKNAVTEFDAAPEIDTADETLMELISQGDGEALRDLCEKYQNLLRTVIMRVIHNAAEAEDVLQDTLIEIWKRADTYSAEKGKPLGWLITLARRRAIDKVRKLSSYQGATDRYEIECKHVNRLEETQAGEHPATREDLRVYLGTLLERLPQNQREVVEKAYLEGWSQRQIASTMNIPLGTVKTRIELGLRKMSNACTASRARIE